MARFRTGWRKPRTVREVLERLGVPETEIAEAEAAGTDELLAIDGVVFPEKLEFTLEELAARAGADPSFVRAYWRAMGFGPPDEQEPLFSKRDVHIVKSLVRLTDGGLVDTDVALQMTRVLGQSMAVVAAAALDASEARATERRNDHASGQPGESDPAGAALALRAGELLPLLSEAIDYSFRRHLRAAARRRIVLASVGAGTGEVIGFADLARFSELSRQLNEKDLAALLSRFDHLVNDIVVAHGGRIVKMIGDAAMFSVVEPDEAARIALRLAEVVPADGQSAIRVGMASGPVLARDGDLYGPVVNLASRLVELGRPGAINVSQELRDAIAGSDEFKLRSLGERQLRHIGGVRVYRLRAGPSWERTTPAGPLPPL